MKQITSHIILFGLLAVLASCKKETIQFTFEGTVTESVNSAGLSGITVGVWQKTYDGNVASTFFNIAGSTTTDAAGFYSISFEREKVVEFKIALSKTGYFDIESIIPSGDISPDETYVKDFEMTPKSWVTFNLYNVAGSASDEFTMIHYNFREGCVGCTTNEYYYYTGLVDSTFTYTTTGGVYTKYAYKNPGAAIYNQDSVYTPLFDTVVVDIDF